MMIISVHSATKPRMVIELLNKIQVVVGSVRQLIMRFKKFQDVGYQVRLHPILTSGRQPKRFQFRADFFIFGRSTVKIYNPNLTGQALNPVFRSVALGTPILQKARSTLSASQEYFFASGFKNRYISYSWHKVIIDRL